MCVTTNCVCVSHILARETLRSPVASLSRLPHPSPQAVRDLRCRFRRGWNVSAQRMAVASPVRERSCSPTPHDQRETSLSLGTHRPTLCGLDTHHRIRPMDHEQGRACPLQPSLSRHAKHVAHPAKSLANGRQSPNHFRSFAGIRHLASQDKIDQYESCKVKKWQLKNLNYIALSGLVAMNSVAAWMPVNTRTTFLYYSS